MMKEPVYTPLIRPQPWPDRPTPQPPRDAQSHLRRLFVQARQDYLAAKPRAKRHLRLPPALAAAPPPARRSG
jgi:hypothetical protein